MPQDSLPPRYEPSAPSLSCSAAKPACATCVGRSTNICEPLDDARLAQLVALGGPRRWKKGETLFREGEPMGSFFKITQGIVAVSSTLDDGRHQIVALRAPGDCAGYLETDGRYAFRGDALTDVSACTFDRRKFDRFVQLHPDLATALAATLSTALKQAGENMMVMGQLQSTERVAHFLVEIATLYARRQVRMKPLTLHITRTGIAAYLGLRVETVSRSLTDLKKRGIIALVGNDSVVLHDIERLVEIGKVRGRRSSPRS